MKVVNLFLDADGVIVDFEAGAKKAGLEPSIFKLQPGAYLYLPVMPDAADALSLFKELESEVPLKVWIATKPPKHAPYVYTEKVLWFTEHFPWLADRIIVTHDKSLLGCETDILVDDRPHKANASHFRGSLVVFDPLKTSESWEQVMTPLKRNLNLLAE